MIACENGEQLSVDEVIRRVYQTGTVVGQTGKVHKLHSGIDPEEGGCLAGVIRDDPTVRKTLEVGCAYGLSSLHICGALSGRVGASHTLLDCFYATRLLRVGGYLTLDDVSWPSVGRAVAYLSNYPCYRLHRSVGTDKPPSWKRRIAKAVLAACPRKMAAAIVPENVRRSIVENRLTRLVVLKKTSRDERDWQWHVDAF